MTEWARFCGFQPAPHHQLIIRELEAVSRGEVDNLLIFMPPGSAKSTYVSVLFPSWHLANRPQDNILAATHSVEFAERWGRRVRNDIGRKKGALGSRTNLASRSNSPALLVNVTAQAIERLPFEPTSS